LKLKASYSIDVLGGGDLTPSLIHRNDKYVIYTFVDSHTRIYFKYFTQNIDGKITLDISQKLNTIVLSSIQEREDIVFIQSDNG
jgi:hypothetical protein